MEYTVSKEQDQKTILALSGKIDEKSSFPEFTPDSATELVIDFLKVSTINSLGIQIWIDFLKKLPKSLKINFSKCPPCIVLQMNMLENFIPKNGHVESVLVPFYCNSCDNEFTELFIVGVDVVEKEIGVVLNKNNSNLCKSPNCDIETDVNRDKYFQFLKRS